MQRSGKLERGDARARRWLAACLGAGLLMLAACDSATPTDATPPPEAPLPSVPDEAQAAVVAFVDVNVVPMDRERILAGQTVLVRDGKIAEIGSDAEVAVPEGAPVIPGDGRRYLMPGLADLHVHYNSNSHEAHNDHILFLANGVTTLREMWGVADELSLSERGAIAAGIRHGPTIYAASPGMDGPGGPWAGGTPPIQTVEQARETVAQHVAKGYDFIKVYNLLAPAVYDAIVEEAGRQGIRVIGHVPQAVGLERALAAGQSSLEHLIGFGLAASSTRSITTGVLDMAEVNRLARLSSAAGAWHTPTITVDGLSVARVQEIKRSEAYRYISPTMRNRFANGFFQGVSSDVAARSLANHRAVVKALAEADGRILLGTDAGFGYILQGFSIHEELAHLQDAGLTPYQALRAGTSGAATFLEAQDAFGTVAAGLRADLILLDRNPLEDVTHVQTQRAGVMVRGRWFSAAKLRRMLDKIAASYGQ